MNSHNDTLVIIPARNEGKNINQLISLMPKNIDVLYVDDSSTDSTAQILSHNKCWFIQNKQRAGVSQCLKNGIICGIEKSYSSFICMDADLQHDSQVRICV